MRLSKLAHLVVPWQMKKYPHYGHKAPFYAKICRFNAVFRGLHVSVKKTEPGKKRHNFALCSSKNGPFLLPFWGDFSSVIIAKNEGYSQPAKTAGMCQQVIHFQA